MQTVTTIYEVEKCDGNLSYPVLMCGTGTEPEVASVWLFTDRNNAECVYSSTLNNRCSVGEHYKFCSVPADDKREWRKFTGKIITTLSN